MGHLRICTGGDIDICRDRSTGRVCGTVAKKRSVGTLGKKRQIETTYVGHVPDMSKFKNAYRREPYFRG